MSLPVSVQICTLNEANNIEACLTSVFNNDPEEVVVIDGGSTDDTREIAQRMGARVLNPGRLGLGPSRKLGYMSATSKYVAFVDADDRIPSTWLIDMISELEDGNYSALQSSLRTANTDTWWGRGWDEYFQESVKPTKDTNMVGRPALFVTSDLQFDNSDFESLDEDTHMSRAFELRGLRQGIGTPVAHRFCEETWAENSKKWRSYGKGYAQFTQMNPDRRAALIKHVLITIPIERSTSPVARGAFSQPAFGFLMSSQIAFEWLRHTVKRTAQ
jgi:glycosyltransferase involved in cell wall biosynthesis